jgi:hypothetical protein
MRMTPEEHQLITIMLAKQFQYTEMLIRILQSRGIVEGDDLSAFLSLVRADQRHSVPLLQAMKGDYRKVAKEIGLRVTFPREKRKPAV